jgi:DNA repair protein RecO (recombination protein O)
MEWTDEGIVLGVRRHGEAHTLVELMTAAHGRHLGLVRGGASHKMRPILQAGNGVRANWCARLHEHLGYYAIEGTMLRAERLMRSASASYGIQTLAALLRLLPERDSHEEIYRALLGISDHLDEPGLAS